MERTVNIMERSVQYTASRKKGTHIERKSVGNVSKFQVGNDEPLALIKDEAGLNVYNYFEEIGVFQLKNIVVLSSKHHFFFDYDKVHNSDLVVNLTSANKITDFKLFVSNLGKMLKDGNYYIGCIECAGTSKKEISASSNVFFHKVAHFLMAAQGHLTIDKIGKTFRSKGFRMVAKQSFGEKTYFMVRKSL
jgi:hypothetical protein